VFVVCVCVCVCMSKEDTHNTHTHTQGFVAKNHKGESCLLGRGGSDTSGSLLAAMVAAHHLEIWTDVYGMFSGDPRRMPHARLIQRLSSREALELATSGAKVLHLLCIVYTHTHTHTHVPTTFMHAHTHDSQVLPP
jgi:aspartate kinase